MAGTDNNTSGAATRIAAWVTGISGVLTTTTTLVGALGNFADNVLPFAVPRSWLRIAGIVLIACAAGLVWLSRKSAHLKSGYTLSLNRNDPKDLVARTRDIEWLVKKCSVAPLVWLKGESGCGKSALIQAGLVPALMNSEVVLPLLLDYDGLDWEVAPARALARKIASHLSTDTSHVSAGELTDLQDALGQLQKRTGRIPLLIFDQIDDYQQSFATRFITQQHSVLAAEELTRANAFWHVVGHAVRTGKVHVLFATRSDMAGWLDSFRFTEPVDHVLFNVDATAIKQFLLKKATDDQSPIDNPTAGWNYLVHRIIADLDVDGRVLPQRLGTLMRGLAHLHALTTQEYDRAGGAIGLDALYVEAAVRDAAEASKLEPAAIRCVLGSLIDPTNPWKTRRRTPSDLVTTINDGGFSGDLPALEIALSQLAQEEVIRRVIDADSSASAVQLDHDYLTAVVRAVVRRADRWNLLLRERDEAFRSAGRDRWGRWQHVLSAREIWRLLWSKLARQPDAPVLFGHWKLLGASALSASIPMALVLGVGLAIIGVYYENQINLWAQAQIWQIQSGNVDEDKDRPDFWNGLRGLSHTSLSRRTALLTAFLQNPYIAGTQLQALPYLLRALGSTTETPRRALVAAAKRAEAGTQPPEVVLASEATLFLLNAPANKPLAVIADELAHVKLGWDHDSRILSSLLAERARQVSPDSQIETLRILCNEIDSTVDRWLFSEDFVQETRLDLERVKKAGLVQCLPAKHSSAHRSPEPASFPADDEALHKKLTASPPAQEREARRASFERIRSGVGETRLLGLWQDEDARQWLWQTPVAEFSSMAAASKVNELRAKVKGWLASSSEARLSGENTQTYAGLVAYGYLQESERKMLRKQVFLQIAHSQDACDYVTSMWSWYGNDELGEYADWLIAGTDEADNRNSLCIEKGDLVRLKNRIEASGQKTGVNGHWALQSMLDMIPASENQEKLVRAEIDWTMRAIQDSEAKEDSRSGRKAAAEEVALSAAERKEIIQRNREQLFWNREQLVSRLLIDHPSLSGSLTAAEREQLWRTVQADARQENSSALSLDRLRRALNQRFDPATQLAIVRRVPQFAWSDGPEVQDLIGALDPEVRTRLAWVLVHGICDASNPAWVSSTVRTLHIALGTDWNKPEWLRRRLGLVEDPITVGFPTFFLLDVRALPNDDDQLQQIEGDFWKDLDAFNRQHGTVPLEPSNVCGETFQETTSVPLSASTH